MNRRAIWAIILLMSIGLLGTAILQVYWFSEAIKAQETRFDQDVYSALNEVGHWLEQEEEKKVLEEYKYISSVGGSETTPLFSREIKEFLSESQAIRKQAISRLQQLNDTLSSNEEFVELLSDKDGWKRDQLMYEAAANRRSLDPGDLESRLDPETLEVVIRKELRNRGVDLEYNYGVYSNKSQSFVILNGNYVVEINDSESSNIHLSGDERNLFNSKFQVMLFGDDYTPPGTLRIHFPNKSSWLWSSLIPTLLGTILFTGLILFCFSYTVWVIFHQKKVSEMKTDFINNMTHEFKTPIATISLAADSIVSPMVIASRDKIQRFASIIKQENKRMLSQVEKVLQMALIDKKEFELKLSDVDMHTVIEQAIEHANLQVQKRGGQIKKFLGANEPVIVGDQIHLSNVIHNLLDNANKYSPESPDISITTRNVSGGVEVIVQDRGIGITKEARKQIFDKFYRVHTGNLHDVKGFGLGLSYVKTITDAHSGQIEVKSEPGVGSSFILYLPYRGKQNTAA